MIEIELFEYKTYNPKLVPKAERSRYEAAYLMWREVWEDAYKKFGWDKYVYSDHWTRQDEIGVLFYNNEAVGTLFFKGYDLSDRMVIDDHYFRMWPKDILDQVSKDYRSKALVCSWFTIAKAWRKGRVDFNAKYVLGALAVKHLQRRDEPVMLGTMVTYAGMEKVTYTHGAKPLRTGINEHGVKVDLVAYHRKDLKNFVFPEINEIVQTIWSNSVNKITSIGQRKRAA